MSSFDKNAKDPSETSNNNEFDDMDFDSELDDGLDSLDDFTIDDDVSDAKNRSPIVKKLHDISGAMKDAGNAVLSGAGEGIGKRIDKITPEVSETWQGGSQILSEIDTLRSEAMDKIVPMYNQTMRTAKRYAATLQGKLPFHLDKKIVSLIDKLHNPDEGGYETPTKEQGRREEQNEALASIFEANQEEHLADKKEAAIEKIMDRRIGQVHHRETASILNIIRNQSVFQTAFIKGTFTAYLKKDLELKYKQLYIAEDTLEAFKVTSKMIQERLDAISKNTSLPDANKIHLGESVKKKAKERILQTMDEKLSGYVPKLIKNLKEKYVDSFVSQMDMANSMLDMLAGAGEMEMEFGGGPKEFSIGGALKDLASMGLSKFAGSAAGAAFEKFVGGMDKSTRAKLQGYLKNGSKGVALLLNDIKKGIIKIPNMPMEVQWALEDVLPEIAPENTISNVNYSTINDGGKLTNRTTITIEQVIPAYLRAQTRYLEILATGNTSAEERIWDYRQGKLSGESDFIKDQMKLLSGGSRTALLYDKQEKIADLKSLVDANFKSRSPDAHKVLSDSINENADDITKVVAGLAANWEVLETEPAELIEQFQAIAEGEKNCVKTLVFRSGFRTVKPENIAKVAGWFLGTLSIEDHGERKVNEATMSQFRSLLQNYSITASENNIKLVTEMLDNGNGDQLVKMGVARRDKLGNYRLDRNKLNRLHEDITLKDDRTAITNKELTEGVDEYMLKQRDRWTGELDEKKKKELERKKTLDDEVKEYMKEYGVSEEEAKNILGYGDKIGGFINTIKSGYNKVRDQYDKASNWVGDKLNTGAINGALTALSMVGGMGDLSGLFKDEKGDLRKGTEISEQDITKWFASVKDKTKLLKLYTEGSTKLDLLLDYLPPFANDMLRYYAAHPEDLLTTPEGVEEDEDAAIKHYTDNIGSVASEAKSLNKRQLKSLKKGMKGSWSKDRLKEAQDLQNADSDIKLEHSDELVQTETINIKSSFNKIAKSQLNELSTIRTMLGKLLKHVTGTTVDNPKKHAIGISADKKEVFEKAYKKQNTPYTGTWNPGRWAGAAMAYLTPNIARNAVRARKQPLTIVDPTYDNPDDPQSSVPNRNYDSSKWVASHGGDWLRNKLLKFAPFKFPLGKMIYGAGQSYWTRGAGTAIGSGLQTMQDYIKTLPEEQQKKVSEFIDKYGDTRLGRLAKWGIENRINANVTTAAENDVAANERAPWVDFLTNLLNNNVLYSAASKLPVVGPFVPGLFNHPLYGFPLWGAMALTSDIPNRLAKTAYDIRQQADLENSRFNVATTAGSPLRNNPLLAGIAPESPIVSDTDRDNDNWRIDLKHKATGNIVPWSTGKTKRKYADGVSANGSAMDPYELEAIDFSKKLQEITSKYDLSDYSEAAAKQRINDLVKQYGVTNPIVFSLNDMVNNGQDANSDKAQKLITDTFSSAASQQITTLYVYMDYLMAESFPSIRVPGLDAIGVPDDVFVINIDKLSRVLPQILGYIRALGAEKARADFKKRGIVLVDELASDEIWEEYGDDYLEHVARIKGGGTPCASRVSVKTSAPLPIRGVIYLSDDDIAELQSAHMPVTLHHELAHIVDERAQGNFLDIVDRRSDHAGTGAHFERQADRAGIQWALKNSSPEYAHATVTGYAKDLDYNHRNWHTSERLNNGQLLERDEYWKQYKPFTSTDTGFRADGARRYVRYLKHLANKGQDTGYDPAVLNAFTDEDLAPKWKGKYADGMSFDLPIDQLGGYVDEPTPVLGGTGIAGEAGGETILPHKYNERFKHLLYNCLESVVGKVKADRVLGVLSTDPSQSIDLSGELPPVEMDDGGVQYFAKGGNVDKKHKYKNNNTDNILRNILDEVTEIREHTGIVGWSEVYSSLGKTLKTVVVDPVVEVTKGLGSVISGSLEQVYGGLVGLFTGEDFINKYGEVKGWVGNRVGRLGRSILSTGKKIYSKTLDVISSFKPVEKAKWLIGTTYNTVKGGLSNTYAGLARAYDDVYSDYQQDKSRPLVSGDAFRNGMVVDAKGNRVATVYDIKGPCYVYDKDNETIGNMVISAEDIANGDGLMFADGTKIRSPFLTKFASTIRRAGTIITNGLFGIPDLLRKVGGAALKYGKMLFTKKDPYIDVYIVDKDTKELKKVINGKDLVNNKATKRYVYKNLKREGEWIPITSAYEIDHEIYEYKSGGYQIIIDSDDLKNGVFDVTGARLTKFSGASIAGKLAVAGLGALGYAWKGVVFTAKKVKDIAVGGMHYLRKGLSFFGEKGTALGRFITEAFGSATAAILGYSHLSRKDLEEVVGDRLLDIYGLLYNRLSGGKVRGDNNGSGFRDGSYEDYVKRTQERREAKAKKKKERKQKEEQTKAKMAEDGSPNGSAGAAGAAGVAGESGESSSMFGDLLTFFGLNKASDIVADKAKGVVDKVKGKAKGVATKAKGKAKGLGRGLVGKTGSALWNAGKGVGKGAFALGKGTLGMAARAGGLGLRAAALGARGALALGGMALGGLGSVGGVIGGLLTGPVGWITLAGTLAYYTYKLSTDSNVVKLLRIPRANAYGMSVKQWEAFEDLETDTYDAWREGKQGVDDDRLETFGEKIDLIAGMGATDPYLNRGESQSAEANLVAFIREWYQKRFLPAYTVYTRAIMQVTQSDGKKQPKADDVDPSKAQAVKLGLDKALSKIANGPAKDLVLTKTCFAKWLAEKRKDAKFKEREQQIKRNEEYKSGIGKYYGRAGKDFKYAWNELKHGNLLNATRATFIGLFDTVIGTIKGFNNAMVGLVNFWDESAYDKAWNEAKLIAYNFSNKTSVSKGGVLSNETTELIEDLEDMAMPIVDGERPDLDRDEIAELTDRLLPVDKIKSSASKFGNDTKEALDARRDYVSTWWTRIFTPIFKMYLTALRPITETDVGDKPHLNSIPDDKRAQIIDAFTKGASDYKTKFKIADLVPTVEGYAEWYMAIEKTGLNKATTAIRDKDLGEQIGDAYRGAGHQFGEAWTKAWHEKDLRGALKATGKGIKKLIDGTGKALNSIGSAIGDWLYGKTSNTVQKNLWKEVRFKLYSYPNAMSVTETESSRARKKAIENLEEVALKCLDEGETLSDKDIEEFGIGAGILFPKIFEFRSTSAFKASGDKIDYRKHNQYAKRYLDFWLRKVFQPVFGDYVNVVTIYSGRLPGDTPNPDDIKKSDREKALNEFKDLATKYSSKYKDYTMDTAGLNKFIEETEQYEKEVASGNVNAVLPQNSAVKVALETASEKIKDKVTAKINSLINEGGDNADTGATKEAAKALSTLEQDISTIVNTSGGADPATMAAALGIESKDAAKATGKWQYLTIGGSTEAKFLTARLAAYSNVGGDIVPEYFNMTVKGSPNIRWIQEFAKMFGDSGRWNFRKTTIEEALHQYQENGIIGDFAEAISTVAAMLFFRKGNPYAEGWEAKVGSWGGTGAPSWMAVSVSKNPEPSTDASVELAVAYGQKVVDYYRRDGRNEMAEYVEQKIKALEKWHTIVKEWVVWVMNPVYAYYTAFINKLTRSGDDAKPDPTRIPSHQLNTALVTFAIRAEKICKGASRKYLRDFTQPIPSIIAEYDKFNEEDRVKHNRGTKGSVTYNTKTTKELIVDANKRSAAAKAGMTLEEYEKSLKKDTEQTTPGAEQAKQDTNEKIPDTAANGADIVTMKQALELAKVDKFKYNIDDIDKSIDAFNYFNELMKRDKLIPEYCNRVRKVINNIVDYKYINDIESDEEATEQYFKHKAETSKPTKMARGGVVNVLRGGVVDTETNVDNLTVGEAGTETVLPHRGGSRFNKLLTNAVNETYGTSTADRISGILNQDEVNDALNKFGIDGRELGNATLSPAELILFNIYKRLFPKNQVTATVNGETEENTSGGLLSRIGNAVSDVAGHISQNVKEALPAVTGAVKSGYNKAVNATANLMGSVFGSGKQYDETKVKSVAKAATSDADKRRIASKIWKYFVGRGWTEEAVAGLLGNLQKESQIECVRMQGDFKKDRKASIEYTKKCDADSSAFINPKSIGYGLAQWTTAARKTELWEYAHSRGKSIGDEDIQIEFLCKEIEKGDARGRKHLLCKLEKLTKASTPREATEIILYYFERPQTVVDYIKQKNAATERAYRAELDERASYANSWYMALSRGGAEKISPEVTTTPDTDGTTEGATTSGATGTTNASTTTGATGGTGGKTYSAGSSSSVDTDKLSIDSSDIPTSSADAVSKLQSLESLKGAKTSFGGKDWNSVGHINGEMLKRLYVAGKLYEQDKGDNAKQWTITSAFRSYADQVAVKKQYPKDAAKPGTSRHESGVAIDLGDANYGGVKGKPYDRGTVVDDLEPYLKAVGIYRKYRPGKLNEAQHFELQPGKLPDISALTTEKGAEQAIDEGEKEVKELPKTDPEAIKEAKATSGASNGGDTSVDEVVQSKQSEAAPTTGSTSGVTYPDSYKAETDKLLDDRATANASSTQSAGTATTETATQQIQSGTEIRPAPTITTNSVTSGVSEVNNGSASMLTALNYQNALLEAIKKSASDICGYMKPVDTKHSSNDAKDKQPVTNYDGLVEAISTAMEKGFASLGNTLSQLLEAKNTGSSNMKPANMASSERRVNVGKFPLDTMKA